MPSTSTQRDVVFWNIVGDLQWRLDDSGGAPPPPGSSEFDRGGGGGVWPTWATHLVAFILGGLTWGTLLLAPLAFPVAALLAVTIFVMFATRRRWR